VARAVGFGLIKDHLPFVRTEKGGRGRSGDFPAISEAVMATLLLTGALIVVEMNFKEVREIYIFAGVLVIQSLPFVAAVVLALIERSKFNDFATWRALERHLVVRLSRRATRALAPAAKRSGVK
jgi:hypothetical protein